MCKDIVDKFNHFCYILNIVLFLQQVIRQRAETKRRSHEKGDVYRSDGYRGSGFLGL